MKLTAITLMEAYIIENLRKSNISNQEIIQINDELIKQWNVLDDRFDYTILKDLAKQNEEQFSSIIVDGYTVKYLTLNGLINLIQLKLDKQRDIDFTVHQDGVSDLVVNQDEQKVIKQILSPNWEMIQEESGLSVRSRY